MDRAQLLIDNSGEIAKRVGFCPNMTLAEILRHCPGFTDLSLFLDTYDVTLSDLFSALFSLQMDLEAANEDLYMANRANERLELQMRACICDSSTPNCQGRNAKGVSDV